jgi:hypothetical protein
VARRPRPRSRKGFSKLNSELVAIRGRGVGEVDTHRGSRKPLEGIDEISELAERHTTAQPHLKRGERIALLIRDAAKLINNDLHRNRVILVFGLHSGAFETATELRRTATRELNEEHLTESGRVYRDRLAFRSLEAAIRKITEIPMSPGAAVAERSLTFAAVDELLRKYLTSPLAETERRSPFLVPPDIPFFVGRDAEMQELRDSVGARFPVILHGLYGMGGVGKTCLATHFCHEYRDAFPDGVLWAQLDKLSPNDALYAFAQAYGCGTEFMELPSLEARIGFVQSLLNHRDVLVVLDNVISSTEVEPLLRATSACQVIVTTRYRNLAALRNAFFIGIDPLPKEVAFELFTKIIGERRIRREADATADLCELTGRLPLAIRIIAERVRASVASLSSFAVRLREGRPLEELGYGPERTKDTNVRASFGLTYEMLASFQQRFFVFLGAFGGIDFDASSAARVAACDILAAERDLEELAGLSVASDLIPPR